MSDIVLKDASGEQQTYEGVSSVTFNTPGGGTATYSEGGVSVQADYEQNNETARDYIKNRPFYKFNEEKFALDNVTFTASSEKNGITSTCATFLNNMNSICLQSDFPIGQECKLTVGNYSITGSIDYLLGEDNKFYGFGNQYKYEMCQNGTSELEESDEPLLLMMLYNESVEEFTINGVSYPAGTKVWAITIYNYVEAETATHSVKIETIATGVKKIDKEFLPESSSEGIVNAELTTVLCEGTTINSDGQNMLVACPTFDSFSIEDGDIVEVEIDGVIYRTSIMTIFIDNIEFRVFGNLKAIGFVYDNNLPFCGMITNTDMKTPSSEIMVFIMMVATTDTQEHEIKATLIQSKSRVDAELLESGISYNKETFKIEQVYLRNTINSSFSLANNFSEGLYPSDLLLIPKEKYTVDVNGKSFEMTCTDVDAPGIGQLNEVDTIQIVTYPSLFMRTIMSSEVNPETFKNTNAISVDINSELLKELAGDELAIVVNVSITGVFKKQKSRSVLSSVGQCVPMASPINLDALATYMGEIIPVKYNNMDCVKASDNGPSTKEDLTLMLTKIANKPLEINYVEERSDGVIVGYSIDYHANYANVVTKRILPVALCVSNNSVTDDNGNLMEKGTYFIYSDTFMPTTLFYGAVERIPDAYLPLRRLLPPMLEQDAGKVLKVNTNGEWEAEEVKKELPVVTSDDNGKILEVIDGSWKAVTFENSQIKAYIDSLLTTE